ncbi:TIGR04222 domain-containing membrane protein [Streptomyces sp. NPDC060194]|uniref:TIGR04222 domain-containing membrane protein n=1 Tax=Streptomyces sp. NPDC060194 TaxID=3347069 RepID=UPI00365CDE89
MNTVALVFYLVVGVSSAALVAGLVRARRAARRRYSGEATDTYGAAFLSGGPGRLADTAISTLAEDGLLAVGDPGIVSVYRAEARTPVEQAVFDAQAAAPSGALHWVRVGTMRSPAVQAVGDDLAARGFLLPPGALGRYAKWGGAQAVVSFLAFPASIVLVFFEDPLDGLPLPLVMFPGVVVGTLVGAIAAAAAGRRITATGRKALQRYWLANGHRSDAAHLVATGGPRQLRDHALRDRFFAASRSRTDAGARSHAHATSDSGSAYFATPVLWCGGGSGHGSGGGSCGGSSCGSSGGSCGGSGGSSCGSSGSSSCGGSSGGSSCGGGSSGGGSSCGSSG